MLPNEIYERLAEMQQALEDLEFTQKELQEICEELVQHIKAIDN